MSHAGRRISARSFGESCAVGPADRWAARAPGCAGVVGAAGAVGRGENASASARGHADSEVRGSYAAGSGAPGWAAGGVNRLLSEFSCDAFGRACGAAVLTSLLGFNRLLLLPD